MALSTPWSLAPSSSSSEVEWISKWTTSLRQILCSSRWYSSTSFNKSSKLHKCRLSAIVHHILKKKHRMSFDANIAQKQVPTKRCPELNLLKLHCIASREIDVLGSCVEPKIYRADMNACFAKNRSIRRGKCICTETQYFAPKPVEQARFVPIAQVEQSVWRVYSMGQYQLDYSDKTSTLVENINSRQDRDNRDTSCMVK
eukprot:jgi/Bigna1/88181/estExt_fgenesh1_pg.C_290008